MRWRRKAIKTRDIDSMMRQVIGVGGNDRLLVTTRVECPSRIPPHLVARGLW